MRDRDSLGIDKDHPGDAVCIALFGAGITEYKDIPDTFELQQYRRHDRQRVRAQRERTYYLNGKAVCKNRHKRTDQKGDSLEEFRTKNPDDVGRLTVKKSTRHYNRMDRVFPGAIFIYQGKEHILTGQRNGGAYYYADGLAKNGVPSKMCRLVKQNTGLVYQC